MILADNIHFTTEGLVLLVCTLLVFYFIKDRRERVHYPPGPMPLPIIGNLYNVIKHGGILEFYQHCQKTYGNVFTLEYAGVRYVVVSGFSNLHYLLVKNGKGTSHRNIDLMPPSYDIHGMKSRPGIMFSPNWYEIRKRAVKYLRDEGMGRACLESRVIEEATNFCEHFIEPHLGEDVDLHKNLKLATSNIIFSMIFGRRFEYTDPQLLENNRMMEVLFDSNMAAIMSKNIPLARWLPGDPFQHKLNSACLGATMHYFDDIIAKTRNRMKENANPGLFVDNFLLYFTQRDGSSQEHVDRDMASTLMQLFGAGTDTSACHLNWALLFMCIYPSVQERVQEEIDSVLTATNSAPSYCERSMLPYTEAVLLETLRCSMTLPTLLPHTLEQPMVVEGHEIPAKTELIFNLQTVYNDTDVFEEPERFNPDRFLTGDVPLKKMYTGVSFGLGRRSCPGEPLARMEMFLFFVTILQKYSIRHAGVEPPSAKGICGTIHTTRPYSVVCTRRTPQCNNE